MIKRVVRAIVPGACFLLFVAYAGLACGLIGPT